MGEMAVVCSVVGDTLEHAAMHHHMDSSDGERQEFMC